jgi:hypothetical protein
MSWKEVTVSEPSKFVDYPYLDPASLRVLAAEKMQEALG